MAANLKRYRVLVFVPLLFACADRSSSHEEMLRLLREARNNCDQFNNYYAPAARVVYFDSIMNRTESAQDRMIYSYDIARALVSLGREREAIVLLKDQVEAIEREGIQGMDKFKVLLALAHLREGERSNCVSNHSAETCILPIRGQGIHLNENGSRNAIRYYTELLRKYRDNLEHRWLLNIAYMTLGEYPDSVPAEYLIPDLDGADHVDSSIATRPFEDVAVPLGLHVNNMAGGAIVDDFDNDGYLDIITSSWALDEAMHYFHNNGDGTFDDWSETSGLAALTGGLNLLQTDYNNDGHLDVFVLRGAWFRGDYGLQPNSLLRNNGDGTFTDVTVESKLLSFHPTQTATWNDLNNDGWLDVFIGNETWEGNRSSGVHSCELYLNNGDDTFSEVAQVSGCDIQGFVKGVASGDYNNDGWQDLFISTLSGRRYLLRNTGRSGVPVFEDVTLRAGLTDTTSRTFPAWFFDYDNDGWLDIFAGDFTFEQNIAQYFAAEKLGAPIGRGGTSFLYRNNRDGTFEDVSVDAGLDRTAFAMGANYGDIDNDGYPDIYLGTGNPEIESIVPNKLFRNTGNGKFVDVTTPARVGHLQKGHAIAFADIDHDGDQDIYIEMGGAYKGDAFFNSLYLNPRQTNNNWIAVELTGTSTNSRGIGSRIRLSVVDGGKRRSIYHEVNSGGSFGASPLRKEIGLGKALIIDTLEIRWHPGNTQIFTNIRANQFVRVVQGRDSLEVLDLNGLNLSGKTHMHHATSH